MEIITLILWLIVSAIVGASVLLALLVACVLLSAGFTVLTTRVKRAFHPRKLPSWINEDTALAVIVIPVTALSLITLGVAALSSLYGAFHWPPIPDWMQGFGE